MVESTKHFLPRFISQVADIFWGTEDDYFYEIDVLLSNFATVYLENNPGYKVKQIIYKGRILKIKDQLGNEIKDGLSLDFESQYGWAQKNLSNQTPNYNKDRRKEAIRLADIGDTVMKIQSTIDSKKATPNVGIR